MAPRSRCQSAALLGWLALSLLEGTGRLCADGLSNYGAFGKWTITASTPEMAKKSLDFAVKYLNVLPIVRNTSKDDYLLIGPTGCDKVQRAWGAERFLVGDNQYHWVWDRHAERLPDTELTVEFLHSFMASINADLNDDWNEWMDYHYGSYSKSLDPYLKMARNGGLTYKLVAGRSEQLHEGAHDKSYSGSELGERVYSMFLTTPDGVVLEYLSNHVSDPDAFPYNECHFRPVKNFKFLNLTDFEFEDYDISKLGSWAVAAKPLHERMAESVPHHTSIASLDPAADAEYLKWLLGARVMNSSDLPNSDRCNGENAVWVHFAATGPPERSNDHYLKFVHNPNAKRYDNLTVEHYINTLAKENAGIGNNRYSPFADDHVGLDLPSPVFAQMAKKLVEHKHPFMTRREPDPSAPNFWDNFQWEKFSIFIKLPGSHFLIQLQTCCVAEDFFTVPFTFCDWDFCQFPNYRNTSAELVSDPETCGYSGMNRSHPFNELLNSSKAIKEPDDSTFGFNDTGLNLTSTSNPHPGHGPMLAERAAAQAGTSSALAPLAVGAVAAGTALIGAAVRQRRRRQYTELFMPA